VTTNQPVENRRQFRGRLRRVAENQIEIEIDGRIFVVSLSLISKANLEVEF
jgi:ribosome maturation factor RimP